MFIIPSVLQSLLFIPGANPKALAKAHTLGADGFIFDLEDSVHPEDKPLARKNVVKAVLERDRFSLVRTASVYENGFDQDLEVAVLADAVLIPKVEDIESLERVRSKILETGSDVQIWCMIETAKGLLNLNKIFGFAGLEGAIVGPNDLCKSLARESTNDLRVEYAQIQVAAKAFSLRIYDGTYSFFKDDDGFRKEALYAKRLGYDGKTLIHPNQIKPCHEVFAPSQQEIERSLKIIEAHDQSDGRIVSLNGEMIEALHVEMAKKILAKVRPEEERR